MTETSAILHDATGQCKNDLLYGLSRINSSAVITLRGRLTEPIVSILVC